MSKAVELILVALAVCLPFLLLLVFAGYVLKTSVRIYNRFARNKIESQTILDGMLIVGIDWIIFTPLGLLAGGLVFASVGLLAGGFAKLAVVTIWATVLGMFAALVHLGAKVRRRLLPTETYRTALTVRLIELPIFLGTALLLNVIVYTIKEGSRATSRLFDMIVNVLF